MKYYVIAFLMLICAAWTLAASEEDTLSKIAAQVDRYPVVRANFVQTRKMADLKRPLVTIGKFVFVRQQGVLWQIERPYRISYILGEDKVIEMTSDGLRKERSVNDLPGLAQVGRIFRAMLGAQTETLREYFEVTVQGDEQQWEIWLKPRQAQLAEFLSAMQLSGTRHVKSIKLVETSGDSIEIDFQETQGIEALDDDELAAFKVLGLIEKEEPRGQ